MELFGAIPLGNQWRSDLSGTYSSDEADHHDHHQFITVDDHLPSDCAVPNYNLNHVRASSPFTIWPSCDSTIVHDMPSGHYNEGVSKYCSSEIANSCPDNFSQGGGSCTTYGLPVANLVTNSSALEFSEDQSANTFLNIGCDENHDWMRMNGQEARNGNGGESCGGQSSAAHFVPQYRWESDMMITVPDQPTVGLRSPSRNSKKRARSSIADDNQDSKNKRSAKSRKSQKIALSDNEEFNAGIEGPISPHSSSSAGEHQNASYEELGGTALSSSPKGKTRASRGSATDPQSVYARKRREKINERLRILQNLVPNGTKVDISTMLEEAVQYVKFLQLQIKLLSSDDLWMYAPLAYNGMDIGLDLRLNSPRL